jgi:hypothetical protein
MRRTNAGGFISIVSSCASRRWRAILVTLFATAILFACAPAASAQMGGGLGGGKGGGGGGGGSSGRDKEKKPRLKRNEVPPTEPAAAREKLQTSLVTALTRGTASAPFLANQFDQASTGAVPASSQARKALAEALATPLKGKKLDEAQATAIAENVAQVVNLDGLSSEDAASKKDPLKESLAAAGLTDDQVIAALNAVDRLIADQTDESVKKFIADLDEVQKEGEAGEDRKKALAEDITALSAGDVKPDETSVTKLSEHLVKGADSAQLTTKERAQLAYDIRAVVNNPGMPPQQLMPVLNEVKSILKAGLVKGAEIQNVASTLQSINKTLASASPATAPAAPADGDAPAAGNESGEK